MDERDGPPSRGGGYQETDGMTTRTLRPRPSWLERAYRGGSHPRQRVQFSKL